MKEHLLLRSILLIAIALTTCRIGSSAEQNRVHAVVDLGNQFTFYADGRFATRTAPKSMPVCDSSAGLTKMM